MLQLQLVFNKTEDLKQKAKIIKHSIADALETSLAYKQAKEKVEVIRAELKAAEEAIKATFSKELDELDDIQSELKDEQTKLSDLAINSLISGETLDIQDSKGNPLEPRFSVKFKKAK